ncbi:hypothetical protein ACNKHO_15725 [Shigella flexneri]
MGSWATPVLRDGRCGHHPDCQGALVRAPTFYTRASNSFAIFILPAALVVIPENTFRPPGGRGKPVKHNLIRDRACTASCCQRFLDHHLRFLGSTPNATYGGDGVMAIAASTAPRVIGGSAIIAILLLRRRAGGGDPDILRCR